MDFSSPTVIGLIVAILVAVLFFILFLIANHSKKKVKNQTEAHYKEKEQHLKESHEEALENALKICILWQIFSCLVMS